MATRTIRAGSVNKDVVAVLNQITTLVNELKTDYNAVLAKLDADAGVTDTNYVSTRNITSASPDTLYLGY